MAEAVRGRVRDMTQGSVVKHILLFSIPLLIGNLFQEVYTIVDTMVAGHILGDSAIAAIGASGSLYGLVLYFAMGMNSGCSIVVTRRFGAHDTKGLRQSIAGMLEINIIVSLVLSALGLSLLRPVLHWLNVPESVFENAYRYIFCLFSGIIATVAYNTFSGILRAFGNTRTALYFLIISSMSNVGLDLLAIAVLGMGVEGAALATVVAQLLSAVLCGLYVLKKYREYLPEKEDWKVPKPMMKDLFTTGISMSAMLSIVSLGGILASGALNTLGEVFITAKTAAIKWLNILTMMFGMLSTAGSTFTGQNYGAEAYSRIRKGLRFILLLCAAWWVVINVLVFTASGALVRFTTGSKDPEMIGFASLEMKIMMPFTLFESGLLVLRSSMQAMGEKVAPIIASCVEMGYNVFSAFVIIPRFGFIGACVGGPVVWTVCFAFISILYLIKRRRFLPDTDGIPPAERA